MIYVFKVYFRHPINYFYFFIIFLLLYVSVVSSAMTIYWPLAFTLLIAPWFEWVVHKYFLHKRYFSANKWLQEYFDSIHYFHHNDPKIVRFIFAPFPVPLTIPMIFFSIFSILFWDWKAGVVGGFFSLSYYMYYEWIHLAHHIDSYTPITKRGKMLKKAHQWHHFKNENFWWGVTSSFGDKTLKTYMNPKEVEKSPTVRDFSASQKVSR